MLFILYVLCGSALFGSATYYVARKTALVQRTLAAALRRGLRNLLRTTSAEDQEIDLVYTDRGMADLAQHHMCERLGVRTPATSANCMSAGLRLSNAALSADFLGQVDHLFIDISRISVELLDVSFPTWTRPLAISLKGLAIELVQRSIPRVCSSSIACMQMLIICCYKVLNIGH